MTGKTFRRICEKAELATGVSLDFFDDSATKDDAYEDDGNLHVVKAGAGVRACFDVGGDQSLSAYEQNARAKSVLLAIGMEKLITDRVIVEEDDEKSICPQCGREL